MEIHRALITQENKDMANSRLNVYTRVFPRSTDVSKGKVSVLAPIGTAFLGCRTGDLIDWSVPGGQKRLPSVKGLLRARKTAAAATAHVDCDSCYPAA
jgi:hypothetical protein